MFTQTITTDGVTSTLTTSTSFCTQCGSTVEPSWNYCGSCGASVWRMYSPVGGSYRQPCLWDGLPPGSVAHMSCSCPRCSPQYTLCTAAALNSRNTGLVERLKQAEYMLSVADEMASSGSNIAKAAR